MVRKSEHDGDSSELHNARNVPALRGRPVRDEQVQDIAGKYARRRIRDLKRRERVTS